MGRVVVAVDPGREKCGVAVVSLDGAVLERAVLAPADLQTWLARVQQPVEAYVVGHRTARREVTAILAAMGVPEERVWVVDEDRSSEEGRRRYWQANPPRGWRRLVPTGLQVPPEPYDDFVAVVLAERYLAAARARAGEGSPGRMEN